MSLLKIVVFASSCMSIPLIMQLAQSNTLSGVIVGVGETPQKQMDTQQLLATLQASQIPLIQYQQYNVEETLVQLDKWQASLGVIFTFPFILPSNVIQYFSTGNLWNIHASDLPNYRGPMPVYWQLRHNAARLPLTLHQVSKQADEGEVGLQTSIDIHPFDNFQTLNIKVMQHVPQWIDEALQKHQSEGLQWRPQRDLNDKDVYAREVTPEDATLSWHLHDAYDFVGAARAGNPHHGGVTIQAKQGAFQAMQISLSHQPTYGAKPGTVLMLDKFKGLIVATKKGAVSLDVIVSQSGYFSGYQFAVRHGFEAGVQLT